ncbi:MAG TPA: hypothetical protein VFG76_07020 [Candidatus Polarisedimenticolia bacterium]|nr:hypothetical protein [Candidatus Polarisedimenticolia bacterium]
MIIAISMTVASMALAADPVAETMSRMRTASTLVESMRRETGRYPRADGALHRVRDVLPPAASTLGPNAWLDAWRQPLWYRAFPTLFEIVSYGADQSAEVDYATQPFYDPTYWPIADAPDPRSDLVIIKDRFVKRPFGDQRPAFETINAINAIFMAASSYAVDNNVYPGATTGFTSVADLEDALVPVYLPSLPEVDGWGHPLLYLSFRGNFTLASSGFNGTFEREYNYGLPCGQGGFFEHGPLEPGGDIVQECGLFIYWPLGAEP